VGAARNRVFGRSQGRRDARSPGRPRGGTAELFDN